MLALPIFPGRLQPSIVSANELNFRVRDGNGWTLAAISTNCRSCRRRCGAVFCGSVWLPLCAAASGRKACSHARGVRRVFGVNFSPSTCGRWVGMQKADLPISQPNRHGTPSGTRTLDTLIKSQVLYQLS